MAAKPPQSTWPRAEFDTANNVKTSRLIPTRSPDDHRSEWPGDCVKPPEVARTYDKGPPESKAAAAFVTMRPTMLCRPTTAKSAPKAAVRWRARRLVSMADTAGSDIVGGMGPPGSSTPAATPQRLPKFLTRAVPPFSRVWLLQLRAWNQPTSEQATLSPTETRPRPIDVPKTFEPPCE